MKILVSKRRGRHERDRVSARCVLLETTRHCVLYLYWVDERRRRGQEEKILESVTPAVTAVVEWRAIACVASQKRKA